MQIVDAGTKYRMKCTLGKKDVDCPPCNLAALESGNIHTVKQPTMRAVAVLCILRNFQFPRLKHT